MRRARSSGSESVHFRTQITRTTEALASDGDAFVALTPFAFKNARTTSACISAACAAGAAVDGPAGGFPRCDPRRRWRCDHQDKRDRSDAQLSLAKRISAGVRTLLSGFRFGRRRQCGCVHGRGGRIDSRHPARRKHHRADGRAGPWNGCVMPGSSFIVSLRFSAYYRWKSE